MTCKIAYLTIGMFETFAAFFSFIWVFYEYGFTLNSLIGAGSHYRDAFSQLDSERQSFFSKMCSENKVYSSYTNRNCQDDFYDFRINVLSQAQAAYLLAVVWSQIANLLIRKTRVESILSWKRLLGNTPMIYCILFSIGLIISLVWIPGLNGVFLLSPPSAAATFCSMWIIPFIIFWDEIRKWLCRRYPGGCMDKYSNI